ncbi:MAG: hypothetical protein JWP89_3378 [Schlesneria sp.]|nr:hypothetical protein [Schlesneria sp.]
MPKPSVKFNLKSLKTLVVIRHAGRRRSPPRLRCGKRDICGPTHILKQKQNR